MGEGIRPVWPRGYFHGLTVPAGHGNCVCLVPLVRFGRDGHGVARSGITGRYLRRAAACTGLLYYRRIRGGIAAAAGRTAAAGPGIAARSRDALCLRNPAADGTFPVPASRCVGGCRNIHNPLAGRMGGVAVLLAVRNNVATFRKTFVPMVGTVRAPRACPRMDVLRFRRRYRADVTADVARLIPLVIIDMDCITVLLAVGGNLAILCKTLVPMAAAVCTPFFCPLMDVLRFRGCYRTDVTADVARLIPLVVINMDLIAVLLAVVGNLAILCKTLMPMVGLVRAPLCRPRMDMLRRDRVVLLLKYRHKASVRQDCKGKPLAAADRPSVLCPRHKTIALVGRSRDGNSRISSVRTAAADRTAAIGLHRHTVSDDRRGCGDILKICRNDNVVIGHGEAGCDAVGKGHAPLVHGPAGEPLTAGDVGCDGDGDARRIAPAAAAAVDRHKMGRYRRGLHGSLSPLVVVCLLYRCLDVPYTRSVRGIPWAI